MKRCTEALVMTAMAATIVALAVAGLSGTTGATTAQAAAPVVELRGDAWLRDPQAQRDGAPVAFRVRVGFATDPPSADPFTVQRAVMFFPDHAGTNGHLFPSCSARQIERFRGDVRRCPAGSRIGEGTVRATAIQLGVTAAGRVTMFNSGGGRSVTFNIQTNLPAYINESLDAPLVRQRGRYGERLTLEVPHVLQEILSGVYVGVRAFDVTLDGVVRRRGAEHTYIRARTCPTEPMRGVFDFKDWTTGETVTTTAEARVRCTLR